MTEPAALTLAERIEAYRSTGFPVSMAIGEDGRLFGMWRGGQDYRVKSGYYGGFPATYLRRVKAMFPDKKRVLHVFSGKVDLEAFPGDTVDINADLSPTYVDDAQKLLTVPLHLYDLVLADPPYSVEDAEHYQTTMIKRKTVMWALARLPAGAHVVWLDQVWPMYRSDTWELEGEIGYNRSTNHRTRTTWIYRRKPG